MLISKNTTSILILICCCWFSYLSIFIHYCCWCYYFTNIVRETINNILLQVAHVPASSSRSKFEPVHSKPAEDISKVLRILTGLWQTKGCPESFGREKGDWILWHRQAQVKTKLFYTIGVFGNYIEPLTSGFWKVLGIYWRFRQTIIEYIRTEKPLTRETKILQLYIAIGSSGAEKPKWRKTVHQREISSCSTNKPKWRQNYFISAFEN